jgi:two-component system response regulator CpxR
MTPLLLVDDDAELGDMMRDYLTPHGFALSAVTSGPAGLEAALAFSPALVILDVMLPGLDGFAVLRQLRKRSATPVIMLTARAMEGDRIRGLDAGADDYLTKPFGPGELLARVRAVLRRGGYVAQALAEVLTAGPIRLAPADRAAWHGGEAVPLTGTEYDILEHLVRAGGRVVSRRELMAVLHQCEFAPYDRSLDVHVSHLRKKLGAAGAAIRTVRGEGYAVSTADQAEP